MNKLHCFKAYDVRGKIGEELNDDIAYAIGRAFAQFTKAKNIVIGKDVRLTSEPLKQAISQGIMDSGANVIDLGMTGTEEVYFASFFLDVDGGIEVTASHNPIDYNGIKFVGKNAKPINEDDLKKIQEIVERQDFKPIKSRGSLTKSSVLDNYIDHILSYIKLDLLRPLRLVVNSGNGPSGHVIDAIEERFHNRKIPIEFIKIHHHPDPTFPNGIPNPLLPENRKDTTDAIISHNADMGIAWDGDFDRCFLFDENGRFIDGYYIVGLLASSFLAKHKGENIIHDTRLIWNTIDIAKQSGGTPIKSKAGHTFFKESMRANNAIYGGEISAHHYFRDFAYCDSGMIPWLLVAEIISIDDKPLSKLVDDRRASYPCSEEINYPICDTYDRIKHKISKHFHNDCLLQDEMDGLSMEFANWRFNLRISNTEPLMRLNIETKTNLQDIKKYINEIEYAIGLVS